MHPPRSLSMSNVLFDARAIEIFCAPESPILFSCGLDENMKFGVYKPAKSNITSEVFFCNAFDKWAAPTSLIPFPFERLAMATT